MIEIRQLPLGPMQTNCYLLADSESGQAAVIDPSWDGQAIQRVVEAEGWTISHILLTHTHFDHIGGLAELKAATGAPIYCHPEAVPLLKQGVRSAQMYGLSFPEPPLPDEPLAAGQTLTVGGMTLQVLETPGHAPGHVSFYLAEHHLLFDGDVLFQGSIGRTDFVGGDYDTLLGVIRAQFLTLPDETQVLSGHGPVTTIGRERRTNPFLQ